MATVKLMLDYLQGPIWTSDVETGKPNTGIAIVDNDEDLRKINFEISNLYSSYYEFDSHDQACWFNKAQEKADKQKMLDLLDRLNARLAEINDGSFEVEDLETPRVQAL